MDKTNPKFQSEDCGAIQYGPQHQIRCSFTKFRNVKNQLRSYCDLRMFSYVVTSNKFFATRKGITLSSKLVLAIHNWLITLTDDTPPEVTEQTVVLKLEKYKDMEVYVSFVPPDEKNGLRIDIREYLNWHESGHTGYQTNGVRFLYDLRFEMDNMLMECLNRMEDMKPIEKPQEF